VFGCDAKTIDDCLELFRVHGDAVRETYRAVWSWDARSASPYATTSFEHPPALRGNPRDQVFPWEQIFVCAASCAGSDYPMLAEHLKIPLARAELVVEGTFDPRGEFDGLGGFRAPADATGCYLALHLRATLVSPAPRDVLAKLHARVVERNMVLGALRGIPRTDELVVVSV
jgi:hypothetical protein